MEAEAHPLFMQGREVTVMNIFTGFVGVVAAVTLLVQGNPDNDLASIRGGGLILLFAFTYLWVAVNGFLNAGGHAFGWYCLFVAIAALSAGIYTFNNANGNGVSIYLGVCWFAWASSGSCSSSCWRWTGRSAGSRAPWRGSGGSARRGCSAHG